MNEEKVQNALFTMNMIASSNGVISTGAGNCASLPIMRIISWMK